MNMIGAPKHVKKAIDAGVDIICAQGGEGGGHTGEIPTSVLIPKVCDIVKEIGATSPLTGAPIHVMAAGGIFDGRGLAMALALGASGVWVGTRFVAAKEAGAPPRHQKSVVREPPRSRSATMSLFPFSSRPGKIASESQSMTRFLVPPVLFCSVCHRQVEADYDSTIRTIIFTGRPMRVRKNDMIMDWEENRQNEIRELTGKGILPMAKQAEEDAEKELDFQAQMDRLPLLMGQAAGAIEGVLPAKDIMEEMVSTAIATLRETTEKFVEVDAVATARL
jgi:NAD(P)H-dependent flavin oxidoreductase YrpB (nitropropane dioxygenase family)